MVIYDHTYGEKKIVFGDNPEKHFRSTSIVLRKLFKEMKFEPINCET